MNEWMIHKDSVFMNLQSNHVVLIDPVDIQHVVKHHWWADKIGHTYYAKAQVHKKSIYMHRVLMLPPKSKEVDHINGNGLDNRRCNLRVVTRRENNLNRHCSSGNTGIPGIHKVKGENQFMVTFDKKQIKARSLVEAQAWLLLLKEDIEYLTVLRKITKERRKRKPKGGDVDVNNR